MPTYEYECTKCGEVLELFQSITAKPKRTLAVDCKECKNKAPVRRLIGTGGAIVFKGSGFYTTDYRSESYKKGAEAEKPSSDGKKDDGAAKKAGESKPADAAATPAKTDKPKSRKSKKD